MRISGIYKIQSKIKPERIYIGSSVNIQERWRIHLENLKSNHHHSEKLQRHHNKYGKNDLVFSIIIGCAKEDLIITEQFYLDAYRPYFNICLVADSRLGTKASEKTKIKLSKARKSRASITEITRRKMSEAMKGKHLSDETKQKISKARKGMAFSEKHKNKLSESNKGRVAWNKGKTNIYSDETKQKMSLSHKDKKYKKRSLAKLKVA